MRIIAGSAKGRRLQSPPDLVTRPMTSRAREGLFSSLGSRLLGATVLDLYAGSGSLGLESLSRGAATATFVEKNQGALRALRHNIATVGLGGTVFGGTVESFLQKYDEHPDLVFVDPPYDLALASVSDVLAQLVGPLGKGGTVIVHRRRGTGSPAAAGLATIDEKTYGDTELFRLMKEDR